MMKRLRLLAQFLKGDLVVLNVEGEKLTVYTGKFNDQSVQTIATHFFKTAHGLPAKN